ncbi:hypothetical protein JI742_01090 [Piscinibacter sp. Jin2]|uniref:Uncharacterized protein n=1 Tax=Aquariibacter lacus TaxID=2801332 RepID=A0A9X1BPK1_9BURK|nr:hypothetical protein [Piscinibacter lacus]MBL0718471.1 hypothetical protein [Piscinibacter lacus]
MSIQNLSQPEIEQVSGGLLLSIGSNPILNGSLDLTPNGIFTLISSLLGGLTGLLKGLPVIGGLLGTIGG